MWTAYKTKTECRGSLFVVFYFRSVLEEVFRLFIACRCHLQNIFKTRAHVPWFRALCWLFLAEVMPEAFP